MKIAFWGVGEGALAEAVTSGKRATSDSIKRLAEKSWERGSRELC